MGVRADSSRVVFCLSYAAWGSLLPLTLGSVCTPMSVSVNTLVSGALGPAFPLSSLVMLLVLGVT